MRSDRFPRPFVIAAAALITGAGLLMAPALQAQQAEPFEVNVIGGTSQPLEFAVIPFAGNAEVSSIVRADLERSGQFKLAPDSKVPAELAGTNPDFAALNAAGLDFVLTGSVSGGTVSYRLLDVPYRSVVTSGSFSGGTRDVAHQVADAIHLKTLNKKGAFFTRIAYVTSTGLGRNMRFKLIVADSDGANAQAVVETDEPILSLNWSPDGSRIAYVSWLNGTSAVFQVNINTGKRTTLSSYKGINSAPSFSPDGTQMALSLSRTGNPEIYVMDLASGQLRQITNDRGIDTEPVWSADGRSLYFTSDRTGQPQIYRVSAGGGSASRASFSGNYNTSAQVTPDGQLATLSGGGGGYSVAVAGKALSRSGSDERPTYAPNGMMLLFATGGRGGRLVSASSDGRASFSIPTGGNAREAAWGPYRK